MENKIDFINSLGALSLTLRMRRLSERLANEGRRVYSQLDMRLEPSWYATLLLLHTRGVQSINDAAIQLGVHHPNMVKTSQALKKAGLVIATNDPNDKRRRLLQLTSEAQRLFPEFQRVWNAFTDALSELVDAANGDLIKQLEQLESLLDTRSLSERVWAQLKSTSIRQQQTKPLELLEIRKSIAQDRQAVLTIARELVKSGDTYAYPPDISDDELWNYWHPKNNGDGFVATIRNEVVAMFVIRPNQPGPGSHVANASYAVRTNKRGLGLGRAMGEASLVQARQLGYLSMQFNIVVSTNNAAVNLWKSLGFRIIGTVADGFRLPDGKYVAHHIMFRHLN